MINLKSYGYDFKRLTPITSRLYIALNAVKFYFSLVLFNRYTYTAIIMTFRMSDVNKMCTMTSN